MPPLIFTVTGCTDCCTSECPGEAVECSGGSFLIYYRLPDGTLCSVCYNNLTSAATPPKGTCDCGTFPFDGFEYRVKTEDWYCNLDLAAVGEFGTANRSFGHTRRINSRNVDCELVVTCSGEFLRILRTKFPVDEAHPTGFTRVTVERYDIINCDTAHFHSTVYEKEGGVTAFTVVSDTAEDITFSPDLDCEGREYTIRYSDPCGDAPSPCPPGFSDTLPTCPEGYSVGSIPAFDGTVCYECIPPSDIGPPPDGDCPEGYSHTEPDCPDPSVLETDGDCYKCIPPGDPGNPGVIIEPVVDPEPHDGECPSDSVTHITVMISGAADSCGCIDDGSGVFYRNNFASAVNGSFTLTRTGGAFFGSVPAVTRDEYFTDDCTGLPIFVGHYDDLSIEAFCSGDGEWTVQVLSTEASPGTSPMALFYGTGVGTVPNSLACDFLPGTTGGNATIEWAA